MNARKINAENLAMVNSKVHHAEAYIGALERINNYDLLVYAGYNAKRGTSSFKTGNGGRAERRNAAPGIGQKAGKPVVDAKPFKGMTGYHF